MIMEETVLAHLLEAAKKQGADQADTILIKDVTHSALVRHGKIEGAKQAESQKLGLRVFIDKRMAIISGNDLSPAALTQLAERACAMARILPPSPHDGLAETALSSVDPAYIKALDLYDPYSPTTDSLVSIAKESEAAALNHKGISNSNGAQAQASKNEIFLASSAGFSGHYRRTYHGLGLSVIASQPQNGALENKSMERDYAQSSAIFAEDLPTPSSLGLLAARRATARLGAIRPKTGCYPVIFDRRVAGSLLGHFAAAINGAAITKGASFLRDALGEQIFASHIHISDDPTRKRGLASRPFDAEGCASPALDVVKGGILQNWLLDQRCGRELGLPSNGRALRSAGTSPAPGLSNFFLHSGLFSPEELMGDIKEGILITEMMGNALNMLTGDYSRGASGFMIRDGQIAEPLSGMTVAGNLKTMFKDLEVADDLLFENALNAPTLRINDLMIAGQ